MIKLLGLETQKRILKLFSKFKLQLLKNGILLLIFLWNRMELELLLAHKMAICLFMTLHKDN